MRIPIVVNLVLNIQLTLYYRKMRSLFNHTHCLNNLNNFLQIQSQRCRQDVDLDDLEGQTGGQSSNVQTVVKNSRSKVYIKIYHRSTQSLSVQNKQSQLIPNYTNIMKIKTQNIE